jgi:hypothetical protein|tara:strand:+ start:3843 stop:4133 length:291 start_codon:yes stop_codon:yes gene_type:complete
MISSVADVSVGNVMVATSDDGGHDPEFWAKVATDRIVSISQTAEPHVRMQAEAFRDQVYSVILRAMKNAIESDRTTVAQKLRSQGHADFADIMREL